MSTWIWVVIAVVVTLVVVGLVWAATTRARSRRLQQRFGSEYDRTVADSPTKREAESQLAEREQRRKELDIHPLSAQAAAGYADEWRQVQARFVDDPEGALGDADLLVHRVMSDRGYPMTNFDEEADLVSVDHPEVVENYRAAHSVRTSDGSETSTEEMRRAMVHYRALFDELLETDRAGARR
jgi:hypothetical protein